MEQNKGNPENLPSADEADSQVFGSSEEFFGKLEQDVNGAIDDSYLNSYSEPGNETRDDSPIQQDPSQATPVQEEGNSNSIDWEKRYKDSSREAQRLSTKVKSFNKFEPLLNVMRKDEGLVKHIKGYLENGGKKPTTVKEELGLKNNFLYDQNEAINNPKSDSAKVFDKTVDRMVTKKVQEKEAVTNAKQSQKMRKSKLVEEAKDFQKKHNLSQDDFKAVLKNSAAKKLSFEDSYYLLNKDSVSKNVASNVRKDVMNQMKNARNIPQSASHSNSAQVEKNPNDTVFDQLKGSDDDIDNLFG